MIILKETTRPQGFNFIPRTMQATDIVLRNETTSVEVVIPATFEINDYYLSTINVLNLKENTFYNLTILNNGKIVYKDKVFCTNQVIKDFTVNENQYIENNTTNEFIIYE